MAVGTAHGPAPAAPTGAAAKGPPSRIFTQRMSEAEQERDRLRERIKELREGLERVG